MAIKIDQTEEEFIKDTISLVTRLPPDKEILEDKRILPITRKYRGVNKIEVNFGGIITVVAEKKRI